MTIMYRIAWKGKMGTCDLLSHHEDVHPNREYIEGCISIMRLYEPHKKFFVEPLLYRDGILINHEELNILVDEAITKAQNIADDAWLDVHASVKKLVEHQTEVLEIMHFLMEKIK
jgi:hypothetical protein